MAARFFAFGLVFAVVDKTLLLGFFDSPLVGRTEEGIVVLGFVVWLVRGGRLPEGGLFRKVGLLMYFGSLTISTLNAPFGGYPWELAYLVTLVLDLKWIVLALVFYDLRNSEVNVSPFPLILLTVAGLAMINSLFVIRDLFSLSNVWGATLDSRYGFIVPTGLFHHKRPSATLSLFAFALCFVDFFERGGSLKLTIYMGLITLLHLASNETMALFAVIAWGLYVRQRRLGQMTLDQGVLYLVATLVGVAVLAGVVAPRVYTIIVDRSESAVRVLMYKVSWAIGTDWFPFGTGGGTFGSYASRELFFSPIYDKYGLSVFWGATPHYSKHLMDTTWPKILGESGMLGLVGYLMFLLGGLWKTHGVAVMRRSREATFAACCFIIGCLLSLASAPLTSSNTIIFLGYGVAISFYLAPGTAVRRVVRGSA